MKMSLYLPKLMETNVLRNDDIDHVNTNDMMKKSSFLLKNVEVQYIKREYFVSFSETL